MAGHIDEAEHRAVRCRQIGEAEIDGDAARLFLLEPVGIDAGERAAPARSCRDRYGRRCR